MREKRGNKKKGLGECYATRSSRHIQRKGKKEKRQKKKKNGNGIRKSAVIVVDIWFEFFLSLSNYSI